MSYRHYFEKGCVTVEDNIVIIDDIVFKSFEHMADSIHCDFLDSDRLLKVVNILTIIVFDDFVREGAFLCTKRIPNHIQPSKSVAYYKLTEAGRRRLHWHLL